MRASASVVTSGAVLAVVGLVGLGAAGTATAASAGPTATATVTPLVPTSTAVVASPAAVRPYETVRLTATVIAPGGLTPTGTVDLTRGSRTLCAGVTVDPTGGTASCTLTGPLTPGTTPVTATYTPLAGAAFGASSGRGPLAVTAWTPALVVSVWADDTGCPSLASVHVTVRAPRAAAAAVAAGLPAPSGTVSTRLPSSVSVPVTGGTGSACLPIGTTSSWTYSGNAFYATTRADSTLDPAHTPRGGTGAPTPTDPDPPTDPTPPTSTPVVTASSTDRAALAATGPGSPVWPGVLLGVGLLVVGGLTAAGARVRRGH